MTGSVAWRFTVSNGIIILYVFFGPGIFSQAEVIFVHLWGLCFVFVFCQKKMYNFFPKLLRCFLCDVGLWFLSDVGLWFLSDVGYACIIVILKIFAHRYFQSNDAFLLRQTATSVWTRFWTTHICDCDVRQPSKMSLHLYQVFDDFFICVTW